MASQTFVPTDPVGSGDRASANLADAWRATGPQHSMAESTRLSRDAAEAAERLMAAVLSSPADRR